MTTKKSEKLPKLQYVESIHEQREYNIGLVPKVNSWLEVGKFTPIIESFDIKKRFLCINRIDNDDGSIEVELKLINHELQRKKAKTIIDKIMKKHGNNLTQTLAWALIKGAHLNSEMIYESEKEWQKHLIRKIKYHDDPKKIMKLSQISDQEKYIINLENKMEKINKKKIETEEKLKIAKEELKNEREIV